MTDEAIMKAFEKWFRSEFNQEPMPFRICSAKMIQPPSGGFVISTGETMKTDHWILLAAMLLCGALVAFDYEIIGLIVGCAAGVYVMRDTFNGTD